MVAGTTPIATLYVLPIILMMSISNEINIFDFIKEGVSTASSSHQRHLFAKSNPVTDYDRPSNYSEKPLQGKANLHSVWKIESDLAEARAAIRDAVTSRKINAASLPESKNLPFSFDPSQPVYRNPYAFYQSHLEMVKRFKIWSYKEGEVPITHLAPCKNIYGIDGIFMGEIDGGLTKNFIARRPEEAHAFYIPMSTVKLVEFLYHPPMHTYAPFQMLFTDYVDVVSHKHPFWNRSLGADHFMVSCHDWAPMLTKMADDPNNNNKFKHLIRAVCNANTSEGFQPTRDVTIPEINVPYYNDLRPLPPNLYYYNNNNNSNTYNNKKRIFAFFAGGAHGYVRKLLFQHWKDSVNDTEIQVHGYVFGGSDTYFKMLVEAKFCLCPSGYEVASPRIVAAIHADCVPVLISDSYSPPFSDVLDWTKFSISIPPPKIPHIKTILKAVSDDEYSRLIQGLRIVKWHFNLNRPAKPFDMLHMILHSIWLRRLNVKLSIIT